SSNARRSPATCAAISMERRSGFSILKARKRRDQAVCRAVSSTALESRRASHEWHFADSQAHASKNNRSGCPRNDFLEGVAALVSPLFVDAYAQRRFSRCQVMGQFRATKDGVDAAVPVDAQNAPTRDLENCTNRSFPQPPHRSSFSLIKEGNNEERCKCANLIVSTEGFTPLQCARRCAQTRSEDHQSAANANQGTNKKRA